MGVSRTPIPSKGIVLEYNDDLAATPTDPGWAALGCLQRLTGLGGLAREMAEHRCLDATAAFVAKYPTGYRTADDISALVSYTGKKYAFLRLRLLDDVPYLWRLRFPAEIIDGAAQTTKATENQEAYVASAKLQFDEGGKEIGIEVMLSPSKEPVFSEGSPAET